MSMKDGSRYRLPFTVPVAALAIALVAALVSIGAVARPVSDHYVDRFDNRLQHLPARIEATPGEAALGIASLHVRRQLGASVEYADGSNATLFDAEYAGDDAIAIRHGDSLRVMRQDAGTLHSLTFSRSTNAPTLQIHSVANLPSGGMMDREWAEDTVDGSDELADAMQDDAEVFHDEVVDDDAHPGTSLAPTSVPRGIVVYAYIHDDVTRSDDDILERHFVWWIKQMEDHVAGSGNVFVHLRRAVAKVTDQPYGFPEGVHHFERSLIYAPAETPERTHRRNILLVSAPFVFDRAVGAHRNGHAIASVNAVLHTPAHELGHALGATHELTAKRETGFLSVCATIMHPEANTNNCNEFSLHNLDIMRRNVTGVP